jgi:Glycosyltransferase family 87
MNKILKIVVGAAVTGLLGFMLVAHFAEIRRNVGARDSIAYWTAARLLISHQNPYDHGQVLQLERHEGYSEDKPLVLRTPPWSLFMVVALGFLNPFGAWLLWIAISVGCLLTAMRLCRRLYGSDSTPQNLFSLVGYTFAPIPACLVSGQMGLVLMLGIVLFLWWEADHPFLAGTALILPFAKPHLLSLFWVALLIWVVVRKKRDIALGFTVALTAVLVLALLIDPNVFRQYREMLHTASIGNEFIPALSGVLRLLFFRRLFWVQFVPMAAGLAWCLWFLFGRLSTWDWRQDGPALLVVSVLTTPYAWLADETVLLPAILQAAVFAYQARAKMKIRNRVMLVIFALLNGLLLLILRSKIPFATGIYFWSSLVWFFWYFHSYKLRSRPSGARLILETIPKAAS